MNRAYRRYTCCAVAYWNGHVLSAHVRQLSKRETIVSSPRWLRFASSHYRERKKTRGRRCENLANLWVEVEARSSTISKTERRILSNHLFSFFFGSIRRIREKGRIVIFLFFSFFFNALREIENWKIGRWNHGGGITDEHLFAETETRLFVQFPGRN